MIFFKTNFQTCFKILIQIYDFFSGSIYSNIDANSNNIFMDMPNSDDSVTSPTQPTNENCHTVNNCTPPNYINKLYSMQTSYF